MWRDLLADESGLTTVEYALLLAVICVTAYIGAWAGFGTKSRQIVSAGGDCFQQAMNSN